MIMMDFKVAKEFDFARKFTTNYYLDLEIVNLLPNPGIRPKDGFKYLAKFFENCKAFSFIHMPKFKKIQLIHLVDDTIPK